MSTRSVPVPARVPLGVLARETGPRLWRGLPVLVVASLPMAMAVLVTAAVGLGGGPLLAPAVAALTLGPAFQLLTVVSVLRRLPTVAPADGVDLVGAESVPLRALPRLLGSAAGPGVRRAVPIAAAATLVVASLAARGAGPLFTASLAVNLTVLGAALLIAPFAYAAGGWRRGAGLTAASPAFVLALLSLVALASAVAKVLGPPFLLLLPAVIAVATATQVHLLKESDK
ncbi:hypothetical protein [Cryptosporangium sp. NPDC051539]|uniref:hypothetical protein n=1 Tax=Cryptosporangium sp. NPDC051539 TaxID=3363962 RepID=UPI003799259F